MFVLVLLHLPNDFCLCEFRFGSMQKVSHKDVPLDSSLESADSLNDLFVPNDLADDGSNPMSLVFISFSSLVLINLNYFFSF